jgi:HAD superfamily hydrolase (TIGR01509 family)
MTRRPEQRHLDQAKRTLNRPSRLAIGADLGSFMPFGAIVFDMDGVLVDSEPTALEAMRRVMARHGVAYTEADNEEFIGCATLEECRILKARHGLAADARELTDQYIEVLLDLIRARPRSMPGVPDVLLELQQAGHRMALASSAEPAVIAMNLTTLDIGRFFEVAVSASEVGRGKPAPDIFLATARRLGVKPETCLVIEDSRNGLLAAKAAAMTCAVVPCASTSRQDFGEADYRLESLPELPGLLSRRSRPR